MKRLIVLAALALALPFAASAQYSRDETLQREICFGKATTAAYIVAETKAGSSDAQIQAQILANRMWPIDDRFRTTLEENASGVAPDEVRSVLYRQCVRAFGREP